MKIFACSDFHGCRPAMDKLKEVAPRVDLILLCGDICGKKIGEPTDDLPQFQKDSLAYITSILDDTKTPYRYILGNDDWIEPSSPNRLIKPETISGITFYPLESVLPTGKQTNRETSDDEIEAVLSNYEGGDNAIVLAHTPPYGVCDMARSGKLCGSAAALDWIRNETPLAWFCGHIHEDFACGRIGSTLVFNSSVWLWDASLRGWIFDTETRQYEEIKI